MRTVTRLDVSHGDNRAVVELLPETEEDLRALEKMWAEGKLAMPRDEKDYLHVKEKPGKWLWLGKEDAVTAGHTDLVNTLSVLRPESPELVPGVFLLPRFYGEVIGKSGITALAEQGRLLMGDESLMGVVSDAARLLVCVLATLDIPEAMSEEDKSAPGQGMEEEKP